MRVAERGVRPAPDRAARIGPASRRATRGDLYDRPVHRQTQDGSGVVAKKNTESLESMRVQAVRKQDNLAADIDELVDRINPKNAVTRWKNETVQVVKGFFVADDGSYDLPHIAAVAGGVIGTVGVIAGLAALASRRG